MNFIMSWRHDIVVFVLTIQWLNRSIIIQYTYISIHIGFIFHSETNKNITNIHASCKKSIDFYWLLRLQLRDAWKRLSPSSWSKTADPPSSAFAVWATQKSRPPPFFSTSTSSFAVEPRWGERSGGGEALAEALKVNSVVTVIDLKGNDIGDAGAKAICFLKFSWQKALCIWSSDCLFLQALAEMLKANTNVRDLDLRENQIGDKGFEAPGFLFLGLQRCRNYCTTLISARLQGFCSFEEKPLDFARLIFVCPPGTSIYFAPVWWFLCPLMSFCARLEQDFWPNNILCFHVNVL